MMSGPSDLHRKILDNMDAEARSMEADMERAAKPEKHGFFSRVKKILFG